MKEKSKSGVIEPMYYGKYLLLLVRLGNVFNRVATHSISAEIE